MVRKQGILRSSSKLRCLGAVELQPFCWGGISRLPDNLEGMTLGSGKNLAKQWKSPIFQLPCSTSKCILFGGSLQIITMLKKVR